MNAASGNEAGVAGGAPCFRGWIALLFFACILVGWFCVVCQGESHRTDFTTLYRTWRMILEGARESVFDRAVYLREHHEIMREEGKSFDFVMPLANPVHMLLPYVPLGCLSRRNAYVAWGLVQILLAVLFWRWISEFMRNWTGIERQRTLLAFLVLPPFVQALVQGNLAWISALACVAAARSLEGRGAVVAGILAGLAAVKPQVSYMLVAFWLGAWSWRELSGWVGTNLGFALLATFALGGGIWAANFHALLDVSHESGVSAFPAVMANFRGLIFLLTRTDVAVAWPSSTILFGVMGTLAAVICGLGSRRCGTEGGRQAWFSLAVCLGCLFTPHFNLHDGVVLFVPAVLVWNILREHSKARREGWGVAVIGLTVMLVVVRWLGGECWFSTNFGRWLSMEYVLGPALVLTAAAGWLAGNFSKQTRKAEFSAGS